MYGFSNKELYELRNKWLAIREQAKSLDNLTPEQLKEYDIHPSEHAGSYMYEVLNKFLDDYYRYAFLKDQASEDPFTHDEIARLKAESKDAIIKAGELLQMYGRRFGCAFDTPSIVGASSYYKKPDTLQLVENAIQKATDLIIPEYSFYKKRFYEGSAKLILDEIDEEIKLNNTRIADHNSDISSIGYDHYEDTENGIDVDYDVNEKYKPHYDAIEKLKANNELLKSFKVRLQKELEEEIETDKQQKQTQTKQKQQKQTQTSTEKKKNLFKRIVARFKKKKDNETSVDESVEIK